VWGGVLGEECGEGVERGERLQAALVVGELVLERE